MKKIICICIILCILLASCGPRYVEPTDDGFFDKKTGLTYYLCTPTRSLRPLKVEEAYLTDGKLDYYTIQWEDPERYLCDYPDGDAAYIYRSENAEDITLESFMPIAALVYIEGNASIYVDTLFCSPEFLDEEDKVLAEQDDSEVVYAIRDALVGGEHVSVAESDMLDEDVYFIRLLSQKYPGLYYVVVFFTDKYGGCYLTDRSTGITVVAPENVKERMVG